MQNANLDFLDVNGKRYPIDLFNPMEAITFGGRAMAVLGPLLAVKNEDTLAAAVTKIDGEAGARLMTEALQRCYTPQNERLSDMAVFNSYFRKNPKDMFPLGLEALKRLVDDFFPRQSDTPTNEESSEREAAVYQ